MRTITKTTFIALTALLGVAPSWAENDRSLFEEQRANPVEPVNLERIARTFPEIMEHGYSGKVLLQFDIDADGKARNPQILATTRTLLFDKAALKLLGKYEFAKGKPMTSIRYEIAFCLQSDSITPVLCDIHFERVAGPKEPVVTVYSLPYFTQYHVRKAICGSVRVRFDVDASGHIQNVDFVDATRPGQFEIGLKRALDRWVFEKDKPTLGIEYLVTYKQPGRC